MPYVVNVNDPETPTNDQGSRQGAEEIRAIKTALAALIISASASSSPRQAVQSSVLDSLGYNAALTVGVGLRPGLNASATDPYHLSHAAGFSAGKAINNDESILNASSDILAADLSISNTSFLYRTFGAAYGSTLIPPQYGYTFDRASGSILNFEGVDAAVTTTDDFGNTWTFSGNAQIDTAQFKFGISSLLLDGTGDYITTTNITTLGDGSWQMECYFWINALPGVGNATELFGMMNAAGFGARLQIINTAGTSRLHVFASSDSTTFNIVNGVGGTNTVWTLNQWNKVRFVFDALTGTYRTYLSLNGAAETQDHSTSSTAKICAGTMLRIGGDNAGTSTWNGWIDSFRFIRAATKTTIETPIAAAPIITDYKYHFFSIPQMKMFEVTAASVVAGVNPTLTVVSRLFLGEADTSGVAVTAIRNYAIRGEYESALFSTTTATDFTKNHNLGIKPRNYKVIAVNQTIDGGHTPGDEVEIMDPEVNSAGTRNGIGIANTRNSSILSTGDNAATVLARGAASVINVSNAAWKVKLFVSRGW